METGPYGLEDVDREQRGMKFSGPMRATCSIKYRYQKKNVNYPDLHYSDLRAENGSKRCFLLPQPDQCTNRERSQILGRDILCSSSNYVL